MSFLTLFMTLITDNIELINCLICLVVSLVLGTAFGLSYQFFKKNGKGKGYNADPSFVGALIMLPIVVGIIIMLVSNDIVKAFSLGGIFVLVRFRTRVKDVKDAVYLMTAVAIGFACGLEYFLFAAIISAFMLIVLTIMHISHLDRPKANVYRLTILVPESLDYVDLFKDVFTKFTKNNTLKKVKVSDFGTLIECTYIVELIDSKDQKKFIDALRAKNGNLNIVLADDYVKLVETVD